MLGFGLSIEPQLWTLLFCMVRIGAAFVAAPVFSAVSEARPRRRAAQVVVNSSMGER